MEVLCWDFENTVLMIGKDKNASEAIPDRIDTLPNLLHRWPTLHGHKYYFKLKTISVVDQTYIKYHKAVFSNKTMAL